MDPTEEELLFALELLRDSIVDLNQAVINNAKKTSSASNQKNASPASGGMDPLAGLLTKISALLIPFSVLGSILSAFGPAFQLVGSAFKILGATILPLVMPLFVTMATALLMVSDMLWDNIEPALEGFYTIIFNAVIPALQAMADAFQVATTFFNQLVGNAQGQGPQLDEEKQRAIAEKNAEIVVNQARKEGKSEQEVDRLFQVTRFGVRKEGDSALMPEANRLLQTGMSPELRAERDKAAFKQDRPARGTSAIGSMREVFAELRSGLGPKASFTDIGSLSKNAQLAALNQSPFEVKVLERMEKMIGAMERAAANTEKRPDPRYP